MRCSLMRWRVVRLSKLLPIRLIVLKLRCRRLTTHREILMMRALNSITDKLDWEKKVRLLSSLNEHD